MREIAVMKRKNGKKVRKIVLLVILPLWQESSYTTGVLLAGAPVLAEAGGEL